MSIRMKLSVAVVALTLAGAALAQTPAVKPTRIRGDIVSVTGDTLVVHRRSGDNVTIDLKAGTGVSAVKKIMLSDIKKGEFIGTAATTGTDGKLTATEVLVFPEDKRGTGEGHYAWDSSANSTMTNANVDTVADSTNGRELKLSYKGGSNEVTVPDNVPVVTFAPATRADLLVGKKVFVVATPVKPAEYAGQFVVVEKDGVAPPM